MVQKLMRQVLCYLLHPFLAFALFLRYRIKVIGLKELDFSNVNPTVGTLLLANHVAEVDPPILLHILWKRFRFHPIAIDSLFFDPLINWFLQLVSAISVPNFENSSNSFKRKQIENSYQKIFASLRAGQSLLLYPSGVLKEALKRSLEEPQASIRFFRRFQILISCL